MSSVRYQELVESQYLKNRTIVSRDIPGILEAIGKELDQDVIVHRYASGSDIGTWIVPPRWDVNEAWIKGPDGKVIASYDDHPLFLAPYSLPFKGKVDLKTLKEHVRCHPTQKDAFYYEHRLAYNYQMRLEDWVVTLPSNLLDSLEEGEYEVFLDIEIADGEMLVGELNLPGESEETIALLTDYCHPGQVNDSFSGILAMLDVYKKLSSLESRKYTYKLFLFPETIGSAAFLHTDPIQVERTKMAIFSEFVGWGSNWRVLSRTEKDSLANRAAMEVTAAVDGIELDHLYNGYGNDELMYDFVGVPSLSVQMTQCEEYHSSNDSPEKLVQDNLDFAADVIFRLCMMAELDTHYQFHQKIPFYMSRYNLYADCVHDNLRYKLQRSIIDGIRDGKSTLEIAAESGIDFYEVQDYCNRLLKENLISNKHASKEQDKNNE